MAPDPVVIREYTTGTVPRPWHQLGMDFSPILILFDTKTAMRLNRSVKKWVQCFHMN